MSNAPLPATLEHLSGHAFAFYPPIRNISCNEWLYRRATWTECIVVNLESGEEFPIPRTCLGDVSVSDDPPPEQPAMVVELTRELEWRDGVILPSRSRVIELPVSRVQAERVPRSTPATVVSIRLEAAAEPVTGKWGTKTVAAAVVLTVVALTTAINIARQTRRLPDPGSISQKCQQLDSNDDYGAVVSKLGAPSRERSQDENGRSIRVLSYPAMGFSVVLTGPTRPEQRYRESVDYRGRVLDTESAGILRGK